MPQIAKFGVGLFDQDLFGPMPQFGRGGGLSISAELWRANINGELLEDLTDVFVRGYVDWRYERAGGLFGPLEGTALAGEFTIRDVARVQPLKDYLVPFLLLSYDDGRAARREQLGVFAVAQPAEVHTALTGEVTLVGEDLTSVLRQTFFTSTYTAPQGAGFDDQVRAIIEGAGITKHNIRDTSKNLGHQRIFRSTWSRLAAANKLLTAIGYYRLFAERDGTLTSQPYRSMKLTQPSATYTARDPIDVLNVEPRGPVANTVIVYARRPGRATIRSIRKNTDPTDPLSTVSLGREILYSGRPIWVDDIEAQADLDALADDMLAEAGSYSQVITMRVLPDWRPGILRTVDLMLGGAKAHLDGRYKLTAWRVGFTPDDGLFEQELMRVVTFEESQAVAA